MMICAGVLVFQTYPEVHGNALLYVQARDSGGTENGGSDVPVGGLKMVNFSVFPRPLILSVSPAFGSIYGGTKVTVRGLYFGSEYSRGYLNTIYGITVYVGQQTCQNTIYVADSEVVCETPPGNGLHSVVLTIEENELTRSVTYEKAFKYVVLYYAGMMSTVESSGYLGLGPGSALPGTYYDPGASLEKSSLHLSRAATSAVSVDGNIYLGGTFEYADGKEVNNVLVWDGSSSVASLGFGTDAAVNTLASFQGKILVGGNFQRVFQEGGKVLKSPLVAFWNGSEWSPVGNLVLAGSVLVAVTNKETLYIGGQFNAYGSSDFGGLAEYSAGQVHILVAQGLIQ